MWWTIEGPAGPVFDRGPQIDAPEGGVLKATTEDRADERGSLLCGVLCSVVLGSTLARRGPDVTRSGSPWRGAAPSTSAAEAEALDDRAVALDLGLLQVVEQAAALADEQQQATTAVVVVLVLS